MCDTPTHCARCTNTGYCPNCPKCSMDAIEGALSIVKFLTALIKHPLSTPKYSTPTPAPKQDADTPRRIHRCPECYCHRYRSTEYTGCQTSKGIACKNCGCPCNGEQLVGNCTCKAVGEAV